MYRLFLKIATRYLLKNKLYTFINIFGLAVGTACFILIMLYVNDEKSYDTFLGSANIYRAYMDYLEGDEWVAGDANSYIVTGETLKENFPEVLDYARLRYFNGAILLKDNEVYEHNKGSLADPSFLQLFDLHLKQGNAHSALNEPYSIVLTENLAQKLFGNEEPMGKSLRLFNGNSPQFTLMLSREFMKLVLISILIALPIAYLLATDWLSQFAYKISLHAGYFIGAGAAAILVALITVGSQAINAANKNPVHALKDE